MKRNPLPYWISWQFVYTSEVSIFRGESFERSLASWRCYLRLAQLTGLDFHKWTSQSEKHLAFILTSFMRLLNKVMMWKPKKHFFLFLFIFFFFCAVRGSSSDSSQCIGVFFFQQNTLWFLCIYRNKALLENIYVMKMNIWIMIVQSQSIFFFRLLRISF